MNIATLNLDDGRGGIEVLVLQLTLITAVHRIGKVSTEGLYIEVIHSATYLLVGREAQANLAVLDFGVRHQILGGGHNLGTAGLVVGAKKRGAVGVNERVAFEEREFGEILGAHRQ